MPRQRIIVELVCEQRPAAVLPVGAQPLGTDSHIHMDRRHRDAGSHRDSWNESEISIILEHKIISFKFGCRAPPRPNIGIVGVIVAADSDGKRRLAANRSR
jgi:hypothetical protein